MAARSTKVVFQNNTSYLLGLTGSFLKHGIWTNPLNWGTPVDAPIMAPPGLILPQNGSGVSWENESQGLATGDEGWCEYAIIGTGSGGNQFQSLGIIHIGWDNPFVGSNSYNITAPTGFTITQSGGGSDNATLGLTLTQNPA